MKTCGHKYQLHCWFYPKVIEFDYVGKKERCHRQGYVKHISSNNRFVYTFNEKVHRIDGPAYNGPAYNQAKLIWCLHGVIWYEDM